MIFVVPSLATTNATCRSMSTSMRGTLPPRGPGAVRPAPECGLRDRTGMAVGVEAFVLLERHDRRVGGVAVVAVDRSGPEPELVEAALHDLDGRTRRARRGGPPRAAGAGRSWSSSAGGSTSWWSSARAAARGRRGAARRRGRVGAVRYRASVAQPTAIRVTAAPVSSQRRRPCPGIVEPAHLGRIYAIGPFAASGISGRRARRRRRPRPRPG